MTPVRCDPCVRSALKRENAEDGDDVLEGFWHLQTAMREQAVVTKRHADAAGRVRKNQRNDDGTPGKERRDERQQGDEVDERQSQAGSPMATAAGGGQACHHAHYSRTARRVANAARGSPTLARLTPSQGSQAATWMGREQPPDCESSTISQCIRAPWNAVSLPAPVCGPRVPPRSRLGRLTPPGVPWDTRS